MQSMSARPRASPVPAWGTRLGLLVDILGASLKPPLPSWGRLSPPRPSCNLTPPLFEHPEASLGRPRATGTLLASLCPTQAFRDLTDSPPEQTSTASRAPEVP